jgi:hypothetical protein
VRAEPDPHHGPAPELRGGDTIAADRNVAHGDVGLAAHYGLNSDIALGLKSATIGSRRALSTARTSKDPMYRRGMTAADDIIPRAAPHIAGPIHFSAQVFQHIFSAYKRVIADVASSPVRGRRSKCADARR